MADIHQMKWLPVRGFPRVEVSESGDLRLVDGGRRLRGYINSDGYLSYSVQDENGYKRHVLSHRLVAQAFLEPPMSGEKEVAHCDGSRVNNHFSNLRWASTVDNIRDKAVHGTDFSGERNPNAKITEDDVLFIRREYRRIKAPGSGRRVSEIDNKFGLNRATTISIAMGRSWKHVPMPESWREP